MNKIIMYGCLFLSTCLSAQVYQPIYKQQVPIVNNLSSTANNYQVLYILNTQLPISTGKMKLGGDDIRFSADSCSPTYYYPYWIENGINTDSTRIWVNVPTIPGNDTSYMTLWYGDSAASAMSNFNQTFPFAFISGGINTTATGVVYTDWFQLDAGDTIFVQGNIPFEVHARQITIEGVILANGQGYVAPSSLANGTGPGGGEQSNSAGAGGGSHGGIGGTGGYDPIDTPGNGGPIYGNPIDSTLTMGSSGGSTDNAMGGNGGGAVLLEAECVHFSGQIQAKGLNGIGAIGRCGGGGAGGSVFLKGKEVRLLGGSNISCNGGSGGNGSVPAHDGGGGGAGGRIKIHYNTQLINGGTLSASGGLGGAYGTVESGTDGESGTIRDTNAYQPKIFIDLQNIINQQLVAEISTVDSDFCFNSGPITLNAIPPGGIFLGAGITGNIFNPSAAGIGPHTIAYTYTDPNGCYTATDSAITEVLNPPLPPTVLNNSPICSGQVLTLGSSSPVLEHDWFGPNSFSSSVQNPNIFNADTLEEGTYTVIVTDNFGCTASASTIVQIYPEPNASANNNGPVCRFQNLQLSATGGVSYSWSGPAGFTSSDQNPTITGVSGSVAGVYTVVVTNSQGCTSIQYTTVEYVDCFGVNESYESDIKVYPNPSNGIVWLEYANLPEFETVFVYDLSGKLVSSHRVSAGNRSILDLTHLGKGMYVIRVNNGGKFYSLPIILF